MLLVYWEEREKNLMSFGCCNLHEGRSECPW